MAAADVGVIVTLNENDAVVHANKTETLPRFFIVQSNLNNRYLRYSPENPRASDALWFDGDYSFDLDTRFEVVPATTGTGFVHIRCLQNNKYWASSGTPERWVTAMAIKPEENQSDQYCTLFQPVFLYSNNNRVLKLRHVSSGDYVMYFGGSGYCCGLLSLATDKYNGNYDVFTFIDWKSVVMLPNLIRIKGDNGNHLKAFEDGFMDYNFEADNSSLFDYEVFPSRNGGIRLKSTHFGTYWTDMDESCWVLLKQASTTVHETNTVFLPTILEGNRIMMRSLKNSYFCNRYNGQDKWSCLATLANYPDKWSSMDIEEPVVSRKIDNIVYHLMDARVYNEKTLALITDDSSNYTEETITSQLNLKTTVINTTNWSNSVTLKVGVKMSYTAGIPSISSGKFEISAEATGSRNWGQTDTESKEVGSVKTVTVKPMSRVKASLMATRLSYDIPFSYTQYDVLMNGTTKVSEKNDGLFTGQNGYGYRYEVVPLPLE